MLSTGFAGRRTTAGAEGFLAAAAPLSLLNLLKNPPRLNPPPDSSFFGAGGVGFGLGAAGAAAGLGAGGAFGLGGAAAAAAAGLGFGFGASFVRSL